jgi:hypothetical protein
MPSANSKACLFCAGPCDSDSEFCAVCLSYDLEGDAEAEQDLRTSESPRAIYGYGVDAEELRRLEAL